MHDLPYQARLEEAGFDVERGWGKRPSMPRDYVLQNHVMLGNTRIGPDLANFGILEHENNGSISICSNHNPWFPIQASPPSPFLYQIADEAKEGSIEIPDREENNQTRHVIPSLRANRIVAYLQGLNQDYELPEMSFSETAAVEEETAAVEEEKPSADGLPGLACPADGISGKEIYMKAAPGGGLCFTCHQPTGLGLAGQFPLSLIPTGFFGTRTGLSNFLIWFDG